MVFLVERFVKLRSKLENFRHNHCKEYGEACSAAFEAFRSKVAHCFSQLALNAKPGSKVLSFSWIKKCFELVEMVNKDFARLIAEVGYPMSEWDTGTIEEFLSHSLFMLDSLNLISSAISQMSQSRLLLLHALSLRKTSLRLSSPVDIELKISSKDMEKTTDERRRRIHSRKEKVIHEAFMQVKDIHFWVCGVVLAALCGDPKPYLESKKLVSGSLLNSLDSSEFGAAMERGMVLKEVKDVNDALASLSSEWSDESEEDLQRRLVEFGKVMEELDRGVDALFSKTLAGRDQLLDTIRIT